jgi:hypothetical protein
MGVQWARRVPEAPARPNATNRIDRAPGGAAGVPFCLSFHLVLLGPTGAHCLDGPTDLTCKDSTGQHLLDGLLLSCNVLPSAQAGG